MKLLVIVQNYPTVQNPSMLRYVHTRNLYYKAQGESVEVLSFAAQADYEIDGVSVYCFRSMKERLKDERYDLLISHAPNVRNHYRFIRKHGDVFPRILFFFHGHEVLRTGRVYPKPYPYAEKGGKFRAYLQGAYDTFKLWVWRRFINRRYERLHFVFVSEWMRDEFMKWVNPTPSAVAGRCFLTYNSVGELFETHSYDTSLPKTFDFVTIRPFLDGSKYAVDLVNELAKRYPQYRFLLYGDGEFFNHFEKAPNIEWHKERLDHKSIVETLNQSRYALMPTRTDAQGVMACEMATFGIPLITSDIPVCHEIFNGFENVALIDNEKIDEVDLEEAIREVEGRQLREKNMKYSYNNVCGKELAIIRGIVKEQSL